MGKQRKGEKVKRSKTNPILKSCPKCHTPYTEWNLKFDKCRCNKCGKVIIQPDMSLVDPNWSKYPWMYEYASQFTSKAFKRLRENRGN